MKNLITLLLAGFIFSVAGISGTLAADETTMPGMDAAAMQEMMKLGSPGENHKILEPMVGEWTHVVRWWMQPDMEPQESTGTNVNTWIMGGRFLQQETHGIMDMGGKSVPFEGFGIVGYDNMKQEFNSVWVDSMVTGMMIGKGTYNPQTRTITDRGTFSCPMTGQKDAPFRSDITFIDANSYIYTMYSVDDKYGKEFKSLEVSYKRKK